MYSIHELMGSTNQCYKNTLWMLQRRAIRAIASIEKCDSLKETFERMLSTINAGKVSSTINALP